ncbi:MAG: ABC transporter ATP-binding protein [Rhizobiaceae bacterium]|nr:ABC transporter ATP-binding protein [Rhizobiaceae bacterium]
MTEAVLEIAGLCKRFGALLATDNVNLELRAGEIHALIGPNGAGKTTLMQQISGVLSTDSGSIRFLGRDVSNLGVAARARLGLGRTFQISSVIPEFSALRNVMLAVQSRQGTSMRFFSSTRSDRSLIEPAMENLVRVGLADRAATAAAEMSHGERRRLEIAIALALDAKAFLLDEPMAGLGPEGTKALTNLLSELRNVAPILLVEHDMDAVFSLADCVSVLMSGRVIASGPADEIRKDATVRTAYLGGGA